MNGDLTGVTAGTVAAFEATRHGLGFLAAAIVARTAVARVARARPDQDPQRVFTPAQRAELARCAGGQCEHRQRFGRRCPQAGAHADHHIPWIAGGPTSMGNAVWLCATHNLRKGARLPTRAETRRLNSRRRRYWQGTPPVIVRPWWT